MAKENDPFAQDKSRKDPCGSGAVAQTRGSRSDALRRILIDLRDQEVSRVRQLGRGWTQDMMPKDEGDQARAHQDVELFASLVNFSDNRLASIEAAIKRLEEGRYGICECCGDDIALDRLRILPTTVYCLDCQNQHETAARMTSARESSFPMRSLPAFEDAEEDENLTPGKRYEPSYSDPGGSPVKLSLVKAGTQPRPHASLRRKRRGGAGKPNNRRH